MKQLLRQQQTGFALLLTLVVVSVVLAIGLTLIDVTLKQLSLSGTSRESELSFHASYAGIECGRYWREQERDSYDVYGDPNISCFGSSATGNKVSVTSVTGPGDGFRYEYSWSWGGNKCTEVDIYILDANAGDTEYDIPNFKPDENELCQSTICTFVASRGYNRVCSELDSIGTIQREVVNQF